MKHPEPVLAPSALTLAWQSASLLLDYPTPSLLDRLDDVRAAAARLPETVGASLEDVSAHLEATPLEQLQIDYVETFDSRRRTNLYLTYFAHGDTRKRGLALLRFKQTYLRSGFLFDADEVSGGELPDHLCVVLEFGATVDQRLGWRLLLDHRAGLELLRMALAESGSPWAGAVASVCATLPRLRGDEVDAVRRLAAQGPPHEEVGLTPYGTPAFDAALTAGPAGPAGPAGGQR
jgi:nitrate reductase delta subunit